jgi:hypothetical protein
MLRYKELAPQSTQGYLHTGNQTNINNRRRNQRGSFMYQQSSFPPVQNAHEEKINEISHAIKQMQTCMSYLMQHTSPKNPEQQLGNNDQYPRTYNGHQENRFDESNQQRTFTNNQIQFEEAKNFMMRPGFTQ